MYRCIRGAEGCSWCCGCVLDGFVVVYGCCASAYPLSGFVVFVWLWSCSRCVSGLSCYGGSVVYALMLCIRSCLRCVCVFHEDVVLQCCGNACFRLWCVY